MQKNSGLTLVELMTVIGIIAILSAIAIPNMIGWVPKYRLQNAASDLRGELQATRMRAIRENRQFAILFNTAGNSYQVIDSGIDRVYPTPLPTDDVTIKTVNFTQYSSGVGYGHGNAPGNTPDDPGPTAGDVSFNNAAVSFLPTGLLRNDANYGAGFAYLTNNRGDAFALGTPTLAGTVALRIWDGNAWTQ